VIGFVAVRTVAAVTAVVQVLCHFADPRIGEASGIAPAQRSATTVFVQNDSGHPNQLFAVDLRTGRTVATIRVPGARNVDWEDLATGPDRAGAPCVWIGDIGDNDAQRREVQVYRVPVPQLADRTIRTGRPAIWRLRYPGGPTDAESLAVAPDGRAYIVTKSLLGTSVVYRLPTQPDPHRVRVLQRIGVIQFTAHGVPNPFGVVGELMATGAALSRNGAVFAVRTYASAYLWRVAAGGLTAALRRKPTRIDLPRQRQGEGITFAGRRLLVDSEGRHTAVVAVALPARFAAAAVARTPAIASPDTTHTPAASTSAAEAAEATAAKSAHRNVGGIVVGVVVLLIVIGTAALLQRRRRRRFGDDRPDEPR
jgi:hypothetical protein